MVSEAESKWEKDREHSYREELGWIGHFPYARRQAAVGTIREQNDALKDGPERPQPSDARLIAWADNLGWSSVLRCVKKA